MHVRKLGRPKKLCLYIAMSPDRKVLYARLAQFNIPIPDQRRSPQRPPGEWKARFARMVPRWSRSAPEEAQPGGQLVATHWSPLAMRGRNDDLETRGQEQAVVAPPEPAHVSSSTTPAVTREDDGDRLPGYHDTRNLPPRYQDAVCLGT